MSILRGEDLLQAVEQALLLGRGGAGFPAFRKWRRIKELPEPKKYVVCNASEGEPAVGKDFYLLQNHPELVLTGLLLAMDFLGTREGFLNIDRPYFEKIGPRLEALVEQCRAKSFRIEIVVTEPSYIGGEAGAVMNTLEGKKPIPRKTPRPSVTGIFGCPTLVHNVETLYDVAMVALGRYDGTRLCTISGHVPHPSVYRVSKDASVNQILRQTDNYPSSPFFVQIGGGASGEVLNSRQAETALLAGCGAIIVYPADLKPFDFLQPLFDFYARESCSECTRCFDGSQQLAELLRRLRPEKNIPWGQIGSIITAMDTDCFCGIAKAIATPVQSYTKNILGFKRSVLLV